MVEYREVVHQDCDGRIKRSIVHQDYRDIEKQRWVFPKYSFKVGMNVVHKKKLNIS